MQDTDYKLYAWHSAAWRQIAEAANGLPHALLLTGPEGIGKGVFALALAARLLCESPTPAGTACGNCPSCRWLAAGNHPDFRHVMSEADAGTGEEGESNDRSKASRQIKIDQIRDLESFVFVGGHRNGARVAIIEPAEAMNPAAQNSLLKILEEPPANVYFFLISSNERRLLPTIRSRCRTLKLAKPSTEQAKDWLRGQGTEAVDLLPLMGGAPLLALRESERGRGGPLATLLKILAEPGTDPLALAARLEPLLQSKSESGLTMENLVAVVQKWVFDLAQWKSADRARFFDGPASRQLSQLSRNATATSLIRCYNDTLKMRALASHPLNPRLYLEDMAERYLRALAGGRA